jgi:hypothetical protein
LRRALGIVIALTLLAQADDGRMKPSVLVVTGNFERPPVLFPIASGLSPLDGNHRLFALQTALNTPDEYFAKHHVKRPPASQSVWIASHKSGEDPG